MYSTRVCNDFKEHKTCRHVRDTKQVGHVGHVKHGKRVRKGTYGRRVCKAQGHTIHKDTLSRQETNVRLAQSSAHFKSKVWLGASETDQLMKHVS